MSEPAVEVTWIIEHPKILEYLLNPSHPEGASKAKFLLGFGFSTSEPGILAYALVKHAIGNFDTCRRVVPRRGPPRLVFEGMAPTPDQRGMPLRTVWEQRYEEQEMRFITAVPLTR